MMKRVIIAVSIIILLLAIGVVGMNLLRPSLAQADSTSGEAVVIQLGTLVSMVKATGQLEARTEVMLGFEINGVVAEVPLERGQAVRAGDLLARLDTSEAELQLAQAEVNLADLRAGTRAEDIAASQAALRNAQANYKKVAAGPRPEDIAAAEASLRSARASYEDLADGLDEDEITVAAANFRAAEVALQTAQRDYDKVAYADNIGETPQAAALERATIEYESARSNYNLKASGATKTQLAVGWSQVEQAQAQVDKLKHSPTPEELAMAQAQVDQAQAQLEKLQNGPTATDLALAQNQVDQARLRLEKASLTAPVDGIVTEVNIKVGERPGTGAAILLADLSALHIDLPVDEIDLPLVQVGQVATVTLDALPKEPLAGQVTAIAPAPMPMTGNVTDYEVTVTLSGPYPKAKVGMTADVGIETGRRANVLVIPAHLVQVDKISGKTYVNKLDGKQVARVEITLGLRSGSNIEVVSGLAAGDNVLTPLAAEQAATAATSSGAFGMIREMHDKVSESIQGQ
jgi:HlyD family secretion protein